MSLPQPNSLLQMWELLNRRRQESGGRTPDWTNYVTSDDDQCQFVSNFTSLLSREISMRTTQRDRMVQLIFIDRTINELRDWNNGGNWARLLNDNLTKARRLLSLPHNCTEGQDSSCTGNPRSHWSSLKQCGCNYTTNCSVGFRIHMSNCELSGQQPRGNRLLCSLRYLEARHCMTEAEYREANAAGIFQKHIRGFQDIQTFVVTGSENHRTPREALRGSSLTLTADGSARPAMEGAGVQIHDTNYVEVINSMEDARQDNHTARRPPSQPADDEEAERNLHELSMTEFGNMTEIPENLQGEAKRIRTRLTWFWQGLFNLSEEERNRLVESCQWCLGEIEMKMDGQYEPIVTWCHKPCNLSLVHSYCFKELMIRHWKEISKRNGHQGYKCFSCREPCTPKISYLYTSGEKATKTPVLDHLALCPWCRVLDQPIKHLLTCKEKANFFARISYGETGDILNQIPYLLNSPNLETWEKLNIFEPGTSEHEISREIRVSGRVRMFTLKFVPNYRSYDSRRGWDIIRSIIHVWTTIEEYLRPGCYPARRGELEKFSRCIQLIRSIGMVFPHEWCRGLAMCTSLCVGETYSILRIGAEMVTILTDSNWGIPRCLQDRRSKTTEPVCPDCHVEATSYSDLVKHALQNDHSQKDLLTLAILARQVRNGMRRPSGTREHGHQLISNLSKMSGQVVPLCEAMHKALS